MSTLSFDIEEYSAGLVKRSEAATVVPLHPGQTPQKKPRGKKTPKTPKTPNPDATEIRLARGERARVTDEALAVIQKRGDLFERGGELVRVALGGVEPVADDWLLDAFDRTVRFVGARKVGDGFEDEARDAPQWLGKRINAKKGERGLR